MSVDSISIDTLLVILMVEWGGFYQELMPRLHLLRSSYDLSVYDFLYDFFGIVGG